MALDVIQDVVIVGRSKLLKRLSQYKFKQAALGGVEVGNVMVERIKKRFDTKRGPTGAPWRKLNPMTIRLRKRNKNPRDILVDTGRLRDSIGILGRKRTGLVAATDAGIKVGVVGNVPYAATMQFGGISSLTGGPVPARPFIGLNSEDVKAIKKVMERRLQQHLKKGK
jgi:phage virion morphogenesis protein